MSVFEQDLNKWMRDSKFKRIYLRERKKIAEHLDKIIKEESARKESYPNR